MYLELTRKRAMRFDIITIFPEFFSGPLDYGILARARDTGLVHVDVRDLREFTHDRHRTVDDRPFGGGEGMVLKPEPLFEAVEAIAGEKRAEGTGIVLLSAAGRMFDQQTAREFSKLERIMLICGRYEGVDERVAEHLATHEISIGDFVLSGGELAAAVVLDSVVRLIPGALGNESSAANESFSAESSEDADAGRNAPREMKFAGATDSHTCGGILEGPHYTRPAEYRGWGVPEVLIGGNHEEIRRWRRRAAVAKTLRNRPDLLAHAALTREDLRALEELRGEKPAPAKLRAKDAG
jgi:tRNA (guanine37-N1)-methyltransferase